MRAVHRIPPEIWRIILIMTISCPLLPSSNDCPFISMQLLRHDYAAQRTRGRLRLVCNSWNELIEVFPKVAYWRCHIRPSFPRSVARIEILTATSISPCLCPPFPEMEENERPTTPVQYPYVEALVFEGSEQEQYIIDQFPSLRLLSTLFFDTDHILSAVPTLLLNLTHLQIPRIYSRPGCDSLTFPSLYTLSINLSAASFYRGDTCPPSKYRLSDYNFDCPKWSLPHLANLGMCGVVTHNLARYDLEALTRKFGSTLQGLSLTAADVGYYYTYALVPFPEDFWECCPRLQVLHTPLTNIRPHERPPNTHPPLRLILSDIDSFGEWLREWDYFDYKDEPFWVPFSLAQFLAFSWPIDQFEMDVGWFELRHRIDDLELDRLERLYDLFDRMSRGRPDFKDRYGEDMSGEHSKVFMKWLKSAVEEGLGEERCGIITGMNF
jgi:hypothetical protein